MTRPIRQLLGLLFLVGISSTTYGGVLWDKYLLNPKDANFMALKTAISSASQRCNQEVQPTDIQIPQLFRFIKGGNKSAFRAGILISQCIGVGDQEDYYRSVGSFLKLQPRAFLQIVKQAAISDRELGYMVTMLPLVLVDNLEGQLSETNDRIAIVMAIDDASLTEIKTKVLSALRQEKNDFEESKLDMKKRR